MNTVNTENLGFQAACSLVLVSDVSIKVSFPEGMDIPKPFTDINSINNMMLIYSKENYEFRLQVKKLITGEVRNYQLHQLATHWGINIKELLFRVLTLEESYSTGIVGQPIERTNVCHPSVCPECNKPHALLGMALRGPQPLLSQPTIFDLDRGFTSLETLVAPAHTETLPVKTTNLYPGLKVSYNDAVPGAYTATVLHVNPETGMATAQDTASATIIQLRGNIEYTIV